MSKLTLRLRSFSFFGEDKDEMISKLCKLLDDGNYVILEMNKTTTLTDDLVTLNYELVERKGYEMRLLYQNHLARFGERKADPRIDVVLSRDDE